MCYRVRVFHNLPIKFSQTYHVPLNSLHAGKIRTSMSLLELKIKRPYSAVAFGRALCALYGKS